MFVAMENCSSFSARFTVSIALVDVFTINVEDEPDEQEKTPYSSALTNLGRKEFDTIIDLCTDEINTGTPPLSMTLLWKQRFRNFSIYMPFTAQVQLGAKDS